MPGAILKIAETMQPYIFRRGKPMRSSMVPVIVGRLAAPSVS